MTASETDGDRAGASGRAPDATTRPGSAGASRRPPRLHLITDDAILRRDDFPAVAHALLVAGGPDVAFHVRGPATEGRTLYRRTREVCGAARDAGAMLVVNDRIDVALAAGADAVQLGRRSLRPVDVPDTASSLAVGASVHTPAEASSVGAVDWLLVGTIYPTPSHPSRPGAGPGLLGAVATVTAAPTIAIGGVTPARVSEVMRAGAWGVAVMRGIWDATDPIEALHRYLEVAALDPTSASTQTP